MLVNLALLILTLARNSSDLEIPDELLLKQSQLEENWGFSALPTPAMESEAQLEAEVMQILSERPHNA